MAQAPVLWAFPDHRVAASSVCLSACPAARPSCVLGMVSSFQLQPLHWPPILPHVASGTGSCAEGGAGAGAWVLPVGVCCVLPGVQLIEGPMQRRRACWRAQGSIVPSLASPRSLPGRLAAQSTVRGISVQQAVGPGQWART